MIQQAKFTYSFLEKALEKQAKMIAVQGRKQINAIRNQNERQSALTNQGGQVDKEIFKELVKKVLMI